MAKGLFTQGMCVLLRQPVSISDLEAKLKEFPLIGRTEAVDGSETQETLVLAYRPEVGGRLLVTASENPWPDEMGDPDESPDRFVAWSLGQFGPLAFPGCLQRASEQSWGWEDAPALVKEHSAHVRLLVSYVLGTEENAVEDSEEDLPLIPTDYNALEELRFLTKAVELLLEMPQAICYFNPGGEVLRDANGLRQGLNSAWNHDIPPLDMWTNVRLFRAEEEWSLMDTVGNGQFDLPDMEAIYISDRYEPAEVEGFMRNASLYLLNEEADVDDGDTADGPGGIAWMAMQCNDALTDPPRPTIRWIPQDGSEPPEELMDIGEAFDEDDEDKELEDDDLDDGLDDDLDDDLDEEEDFDDEDDDEDDDYDDDDLATGFGDNSMSPLTRKTFGSDLFSEGIVDDELDEDLDADFPENESDSDEDESGKNR
jgi:Domain of unknown function (DUF4261)